MQLPYHPMPSTTPRNRRRLAASSGGPKRNELSSATGRAPMARISRTMPPTPVAAPCNGSTAEGWLCDSTLNTTASPLPMSIAPAFSAPACDRVRLDVEGSIRSSGRECL